MDSGFPLLKNCPSSFTKTLNSSHNSFHQRDDDAHKKGRTSPSPPSRDSRARGDASRSSFRTLDGVLFFLTDDAYDEVVAAREEEEEEDKKEDKKEGVLR